MPSDELAKFVITFPDESAMAGSVARGAAIAAIVNRPRGPWAKALLALANQDDDAFEALYILRRDLTNHERGLVGDCAKVALTQRYPHPYSVADRYICWARQQT